MGDLSKMLLVGGVIAGFNREVGEIGMMATVKKMLVRTKTNLEIRYGQEETKKILEKGPVIVVVNHPHQSDVMMIMAALPNRKDFFMIAQSTLMGLGRKIDRHIIPVFINEKQVAMKIWKKWKLEIFTKLHSPSRMPREMEKAKNRESIALASKKLDLGQMVIIFPAGGSENGGWLAGVGYLVKGAKNPGLKIVMANITGSSSWDYFRLIPGISGLLPTIKVRFSAPIGVEELEENEAKEVAWALEKRYRKWLED